MMVLMIIQVAMPVRLAGRVVPNPGPRGPLSAHSKTYS